MSEQPEVEDAAQWKTFEVSLPYNARCPDLGIVLTPLKEGNDTLAMVGVGICLVVE